MKTRRVIAGSVAALFCILALSGGADAQHRDRSRSPQATPEDSNRQFDRERSQRRSAPDRGQVQRQRQAQPAPRARTERRVERRSYDRPAEREWHRDRPAAKRQIYIPHRWRHVERPHHRHLAQRHYGRVWWCGTGCRIALLFGFTVWAVDTVLSADSAYDFPAWEALEYNRTGETSLWESDWGYVEFTPTRTFKRRFGRFVRDCRDFLRVVVRNDGRERRLTGTACRNPHGSWWIASGA